MRIPYRPEIDGLRAVAVIAVIVYHAEIFFSGLTWLSGGYFGVDIFFVISGYLIGKIILSEVRQSGSFRYGNFLERRARRILPILFTTMLVSLPFAWFLLLPTAFTEYAQSILSSVFFGSNIFFYFAVIEYGAGPSLLKPFLHTWSLSVEEQFYLAFPVVLLTMEKFLQKRTFALLASLTAASLLFMGWVSRSDPSLAFFLLPSRAWELLIGTLLAYSELSSSARTRPPSSAALSTFGFLLIAFAFIFFDEQAQHPGLATFLPVIGTALVIRYAGKEDVVGRILSMRLLVGAGLISYSLYLWHFPVFSFSRIFLDHFTLSDKLLAIALTFVLSVLSYKFIERPFRNQGRYSRERAVPALALAAMLLSAIAMTITFGKGDLGRYDHLKSLIAGYEPDNEKLLDETWVLVKERPRRFKSPDTTAKILIVGNSHAKDLYNVFATNPSFFPNYEFVRYPMQISYFSKPHRLADKFFKNSAYREADVIFISTRYLESRKELQGINDIQGLDLLAKRVLSDEKILVVTNNTVEFFWNGKRTLYDSLLLQASLENDEIRADFFKTVNRRYFLEMNKSRASSVVDNINEMIAALSRKHGFILLKKEDYLCDFPEEICFGATDEGHKAFYDYGHYTMQGAAYFGKRIHQLGWLKPLEQALAKRR